MAGRQIVRRGIDRSMTFEERRRERYMRRSVRRAHEDELERLIEYFIAIVMLVALYLITWFVPIIFC